MLDIHIHSDRSDFHVLNKLLTHAHAPRSGAPENTRPGQEGDEHDVGYLGTSRGVTRDGRNGGWGM